MKYKFYFFYLLLAFTGTTLYAQGENNNWYFEYGYHLDFNSNPPVLSRNSGIYAWESTASVSDAQGNVLFYTIGSRIWDRNGNEMPNANGLSGNGPVINGIPIGSGRQSVQIIANPVDPHQYYVFVGSADQDVPGPVYYHLVDMRLNGGNGDVVPTQKNVMILPKGSTEYTAVAYGGACNTFWFIIAGNFEYNYGLHAFKVDQNGVDPNPVVSYPMLSGLSVPGHLKVSATNGLAYYRTNLGIVRTQFDNLTGVFSNFELIPNTHGYGSLELSPNENLLYAIGVSTAPYLAPVWQYNLQLYPDLNAIGASGVQVAEMKAWDIRTGPDNQVYMIDIDRIIRVKNPDVVAPGNIIDTFYTFPPDTTLVGYPVLGAAFLPRIAPDTSWIGDRALDTVVCEGTSVTMASPRQGMAYYRWNTGAEEIQTTAEQPGVYWVYSYTYDCKVFIDTFILKTLQAGFDLGRDTSLCRGQKLNLYATQQGAENYLWSTGATGDRLTVGYEGTYWVQVKVGDCLFIDSIKVKVLDTDFAIDQQDTLICEGDKILLHAHSEMGSAITWNTGMNGNTIEVTEPGTYTASTHNDCGTQQDSVTISRASCDCEPVFPTAFSPNGDGLNDVFLALLKPSCVFKTYEFTIYNRYGNVVYSGTQSGRGWDGTYKNFKPAELGVYTYTLKLKDLFDHTKTYKGNVVLAR